MSLLLFLFFFGVKFGFFRFISGITLIGHPTEMYLYGSEFFLALTCMVPMAVIFYFFYLPVFCDLRLSSTYEVGQITDAGHFNVFFIFIKVSGNAV